MLLKTQYVLSTLLIIIVGDDLVEFFGGGLLGFFFINCMSGRAQHLYILVANTRFFNREGV